MLQIEPEHDRYKRLASDFEYFCDQVEIRRWGDEARIVLEYVGQTPYHLYGFLMDADNNDFDIYKAGFDFWALLHARLHALKEGDNAGA